MKEQEPRKEFRPKEGGKLTPDQAADVRMAVETARRGGVILYPTDTVWGLGCDASNPEAVRRIFDIKKRADSKALITLVGSMAQLERVVEDIPEVGYELLECATEPLTIVYDGARPGAVATELLAPDGTIGVRLTSEAISGAICRGLRKPVVSTSANISGARAPRVFSEISPEIIAAADYVCLSRRDEQPDAGRKPSGIIRLSRGGLFKIIR